MLTIETASTFTRQDWGYLVRKQQVRERICNSIVPSTVLPYFTDIISQQDEQQIQAVEQNKGPITAANLFVDVLANSRDDRWPTKLLQSLTPSDSSSAPILVEFLKQEMSQYEPDKGTSIS